MHLSATLRLQYLGENDSSCLCSALHMSLLSGIYQRCKKEGKGFSGNTFRILGGKSDPNRNIEDEKYKYRNRGL